MYPLSSQAKRRSDHPGRRCMTTGTSTTRNCAGEPWERKVERRKSSAASSSSSSSFSSFLSTREGAAQRRQAATEDHVFKLIHPLLLLSLLQKGEDGAVNNCHTSIVQPWHAQQRGRLCARCPWQRPLRLGHSCEPARPTPTEFLPDTGGLQSPWNFVRTWPPTPRRTVVSGLLQCRSDRHPLMSPP